MDGRTDWMKLMCLAHLAVTMMSSVVQMITIVVLVLFVATVTWLTIDVKLLGSAINDVHRHQQRQPQKLARRSTDGAAHVASRITGVHAFKVDTSTKTRKTLVCGLPPHIPKILQLRTRTRITRTRRTRLFMTDERRRTAQERISRNRSSSGRSPSTGGSTRDIDLYYETDDDDNMIYDGKEFDEGQEYVGYGYDDEEAFRSTQRRNDRRNEAHIDTDDDGYYDNLEPEQRRKKHRPSMEDMSSDSQTGRRTTSSSGNSNSTIYKVVFNDDVSPYETQLTWETCNYNPRRIDDDDEYMTDRLRKDELPDESTEAIVLLPPASVERPTAVVHFVGGTFFGSRPRLFYGRLLEDIVRNTNVAIVVTPIPVTLTKSPLDHIRLTSKLRKSFEYAWRTVLEDEYCSDDFDTGRREPINGNAEGDSPNVSRTKERKNGLDGVPVCGLGHSLGARLLTVLTTKDRNLRQQSRQIPPYKSMILISFTNFGANAGIPGIAALLRQSRQQERREQVKTEQERNQRARRRRSEWSYDYDNGVTGSRFSDVEDDEDWDDVLDSLQSLVKQQAERIKNALTPKSSDLEFKPSPDQLWRAMKDDHRYDVNQTLVVQFDDDTIDQSSKLAQILHDTNSSDLKFARLRGTHLTPLSLISDDDGSTAVPAGATLSNINNPALQTLYRALLGRSKTREQADSLRALRQSIVSYITDVVTK